MAFADSDDFHSNWPTFGQNYQKTASNDIERKISTSNVAKLASKWAVTTGGDVSARTAVVDRVVYWGSGYSHLPIPRFVGNNKFYASRWAGSRIAARRACAQSAS